MGIMGCYPDKRAVENELGGKWELFFEEDFEEEVEEGFEFTNDIDGTPLNLVGIMISVNRGDGASTLPFRITIDGFPKLNLGLGTLIKNVSCVIRNGAAIFTTWGGNANNIGGVSEFTQMVLKDFIHNFKIDGQTWAANSKISIYVLRGV